MSVGKKMSGSQLNVSTPLHVHVKLMGVYVCACRYKSMCITIMGVYNVHVHSDVETASHAGHCSINLVNVR